MLVQYLREKYYSIFHGIYFDSNERRGTLLPHIGENMLVNLKRRGDYLEIEKKGQDAMIRMIPSKHCMGYIVECHRDGEIVSRGTLNFDDMWKSVAGNNGQFEKKLKTNK